MSPFPSKKYYMHHHKTHHKHCVMFRFRHHLSTLQLVKGKPLFMISFDDAVCIKAVPEIEEYFPRGTKFDATTQYIDKLMKTHVFGMLNAMLIRDVIVSHGLVACGVALMKGDSVIWMLGLECVNLFVHVMVKKHITNIYKQLIWND